MRISKKAHNCKQKNYPDWLCVWIDLYRGLSPGPEEQKIGTKLSKYSAGSGVAINRANTFNASEISLMDGTIQLRNYPRIPLSAGISRSCGSVIGTQSERDTGANPDVIPNQFGKPIVILWLNLYVLFTLFKIGDPIKLHWPYLYSPVNIFIETIKYTKVRYNWL